MTVKLLFNKLLQLLFKKSKYIKQRVRLNKDLQHKIHPQFLQELLR